MCVAGRGGGALFMVAANHIQMCIPANRRRLPANRSRLPANPRRRPANGAPYIIYVPTGRKKSYGRPWPTSLPHCLG